MNSSNLTRRAELRRSGRLENRLHAFISEWNQYAEPFAWTRKSFDNVLAKIDAELPRAA